MQNFGVFLGGGWVYWTQKLSVFLILLNSKYQYIWMWGLFFWLSKFFRSTIPYREWLRELFSKIRLVLKVSGSLGIFRDSGTKIAVKLLVPVLYITSGFMSTGSRGPILWAPKQGALSHSPLFPMEEGGP